MNLPLRPDCFGQSGPITCPCSTWDTPKMNDCISSRYFWLAAKCIAELPNNRARKNHIDIVGSTRGPVAADRLKAAAKELMGEAACSP